MTTWVLEWGPTARRWVLLTTLIALPLTYLPRLAFDPYWVPKLALLTAGTSIAASIRLIEMACGGSLRTLRNFVWPALFVAVPLLISWIFSPYRGWALMGQYPGFQGLFPYITLIAFAALLAEAFAGRATSIAWGLVASAGAVGVYGFAQIMGLDPLKLIFEDRFADSVRSTIGNSNFVGGFMAIALPAAVGLWMARVRGHRWVLGSIIFIGEAWLFAGSQAAWAAGAAGVLVTAGLMLKERLPWIKRVALGLAFLAAFSIVGVTIWGAIDPGNRLIPHTIRLRSRWWTQAVEMTASSPLVGRGPNTFAIEGVAFRSPSDALELGYIFSDDPHAVPLSFAANAGLLGLAGYAGLFGWLVVRSRRGVAGDPLQCIFIGSATAGFIVGLGILDELTTRTGLWVSLAGLAASQAAVPAVTDSRMARRKRWSPLVLLIALGILGGAWWSGRFLAADIEVRRGTTAFGAEDTASAISHFESALDFREEYEYRQLYGFELGGAALRRQEQGEPLIGHMRAQFSFLAHFPQIRAMVTQARRLFEWSLYEPAAAAEALALYDRVSAIDPFNPLIAVEKSDIFVLDGQPERALQLLQPFESKVPFASNRYQDYYDFWGALALAHLELGDESSARAALRSAGSDTGECRVELANEILRLASLPRVPRSYEPPLVLIVLCQPVMLELLPVPD